MNEGADNGYVCCEEASVFSPLVKIEVEPSKSNANYIHLRFSHTNKYWAKSGDHRWVVPTSNQAEEDTSKSSCSLFEPAVRSDGVLHLTHVQTGSLVRTDESGRVYVDEDTEDGEVGAHAFRFVDLDTLVKISERVAFVGDNGKYLQAVWFNGQPCFQFSGSDGNDDGAAYEVQMLPDGHLRLKSEHLGRFWRRGDLRYKPEDSARFWRNSPDWILGDSIDDKGEDVDTRYWPVKVDGERSTIALRCAGNDQFCCRFTTDGKTDCLNATASSLTEEARLVVRELVLERNIYNVRYRMEDARVFDEQLVVLGVGTVSNDSDMEVSLTITIAYDDTSFYTFSNSFSIKLGVKTTTETAIPFIADGGGIKITAAVTNELEWDRLTEQTKKAEVSYTVQVPARTKVSVSYVATRGNCSFSFSYMQRDKSSSDGRFITTENIDGIFYGVNHYSFRFEQPLMLAI